MDEFWFFLFIDWEGLNPVLAFLFDSFLLLCFRFYHLFRAVCGKIKLVVDLAPSIVVFVGIILLCIRNLLYCSAFVWNRYCFGAFGMLNCSLCGNEVWCLLVDHVKRRGYFLVILFVKVVSVCSHLIFIV